jgi:hypothetical protein
MPLSQFALAEVERQAKIRNPNIEAPWLKIPNYKSQIPNNLELPITPKTNKRIIF